MAGFGDRLAAMKAKQEAGTAKKSEQMEAERKAKETAEKKNELLQRREASFVALASAEKQKNEADAALAEADAFAQEQGENLDSDAKAEIDALKAEAGETIKNFEALKSELEQIDEELKTLEGTEDAARVVEAPTETTEAESVKAEERQETSSEKQPFDEEQEHFFKSVKIMDERSKEYKQIFQEVKDELEKNQKSTELTKDDPRVQRAFNAFNAAQSDFFAQENILRNKSKEAGWKFDEFYTTDENKLRIVYLKLSKSGGTSRDSEKLIVEK